MRKPIDVSELVDGVRAGSRSAVARSITLVESKLPAHRPLARALLTELATRPAEAIRVGISGVPGAGKSTFIDAMGRRLIDRGHRIAVLAVDPSSSRTGGSVLGDRTRMGLLSQHDEAFIRPSPSGNHLGGVARATREAITVVEAAGFDVVIVETVGVGQSEVAVAGMVDTFLMLALARSGDQLQGIKRGILEIADVIAVNKADGDNAGEARVTARELTIAMKLITQDTGERRSPVLTCSALTGEGLDDVWAAVVEHRDWLTQTGSLAERRIAQELDWQWAMVTEAVRETLTSSQNVKELRPEIEARVSAGELSALDGSLELIKAWREGLG